MCSMEEADVLGDRVAVLARGRLRALGSSIRLKQKFGAGYQVVVTLQVRWPGVQRVTHTCCMLDGGTW